MEHTTMLGGNLWIWVIFIGFMILGWLVSHQLKSRFAKYSKIPTDNGMTGRDVVEKMLRDNGITGVKIGSVDGQLTDHYNPVNKTINLSKEVYYGNSTRMRTRRTARQGIQYVKTAVGTGTGCHVRIPLGTMGSAGRHPVGEYLPPAFVGRDYPFRFDDPVQLCYTTG